MSKIIEPVEPYSQDWFKLRAFESLRQVKRGMWDYSDSLLLYTPGGEEQYETVQSGEDLYAKLITQPETAYLQEIADDLVTHLPDRFEYIDLGPGTAHKEQYIFDAAKRQGKTFLYRPTDISEHYIDLSTQHARAQGIETAGIQASFEELPDRLGAPPHPRFVSLGLTFSNYPPHEILSLLKRIAGVGGFVFINAQMRDRMNMKSYLQMYEGMVYPITDPKLQLLSLDPKADVTKKWVEDGVRVWYTLERVTPQLEAYGMEKGDTLLLLQSLRYTKEALEQALKDADLEYEVFDRSSSFIAALGQVP